MTASFNLALGEQSKPAFHQIELRAAGRSQVHMKTNRISQPAMDPSGFACCVVISNRLDLKMGGHLSIDDVEELAKL